MKSKALVLLSSLVLSGAALAQAKAEPDYTLSFNVGAVTDYRYRGISQTRLKPALQGGADFAHKSGLYLGAWGSTIKWIKDAGGGADVEVDLYGGYKFSAGPVGLDVGVLTYNYPDHGLAVSPNTQEAYVAGSWGPATLKYSHAFSNLFGFANSKNSYYWDLSATFDLGNGWALVPHVGYQKVKNNAGFSYTDYSVTVNKDFGNGFTASAAYVDTDSNGAYLAPNGKNLGRGGLVLGAKYTF
jgi:uncharacterized protein (TIGR02001 family)